MPSPDLRHPVAIAAEWVSRITAIGFAILACIWLGTWLDGKCGTRWFTPFGVILGPVLGFWQLLVISRAQPRGGGQQERSENP